MVLSGQKRLKMLLILAMPYIVVMSDDAKSDIELIYHIPPEKIEHLTYLTQSEFNETLLFT